MGNISISGKDYYNYDYAIGFAVDNSMPEYTTDMSTTPYNIERDGTLWTIPANNGESYNFTKTPMPNINGWQNVLWTLDMSLLRKS